MRDPRHNQMFLAAATFVLITVYTAWVIAGLGGLLLSVSVWMFIIYMIRGSQP